MRNPACGKATSVAWPKVLDKTVGLEYDEEALSVFCRMCKIYRDTEGKGRQ
jgi:hypothetical protein